MRPRSLLAPEGPVAVEEEEVQDCGGGRGCGGKTGSAETGPKTPSIHLITHTTLQNNPPFLVPSIVGSRRRTLAFHPTTFPPRKQGVKKM